MLFPTTYQKLTGRKPATIDRVIGAPVEEMPLSTRSARSLGRIAARFDLDIYLHTVKLAR